MLKFFFMTVQPIQRIIQFSRIYVLPPCDQMKSLLDRGILDYPRDVKIDKEALETIGIEDVCAHFVAQSL